MGLKNNMLIAAEACFEMDPSQKNDAWVDRNLIHIYDTPTPKRDPFTHHLHTQNITKHSKTSQNKNSGKP